MAVGDDATAAGFPLVPDTGTEDARVRWGAREINRTRDLVAQVKTMVSSVWGITQGGTGATTAAAARVNLQVPHTSHTHDVRYYTRAQTDTFLGAKADKPLLGNRAVGDVTGANRIGLRWNGNKPVFRVDNTEFELARMIDLGGSSARFKTDIQDWSVDTDAVLRLRPVSFIRKESGEQEWGLVAEEVAQTVPELAWWVTDPDIPDAEPRLEGVHYTKVAIALLGVVQKQEQRINELERLLRARKDEES